MADIWHPLTSRTKPPIGLGMYPQHTGQCAFVVDGERCESQWTGPKNTRYCNAHKRAAAMQVAREYQRQRNARKKARHV